MVRLTLKVAGFYPLILAGFQTADYNLFITSASEELLDIENAWKAYTLRWQIELVFKIWKSLWKIDKVKKVKKERLECYIYSKLFIIVLSLNMLWITHNLMRGLYGVTADLKRTHPPTKN